MTAVKEVCCGPLSYLFAKCSPALHMLTNRHVPTAQQLLAAPRHLLCGHLSGEEGEERRDALPVAVLSFLMGLGPTLLGSICLGGTLRLRAHFVHLSPTLPQQRMHLHPAPPA